ncbi:hypothetical protein GCM10022243_13200 [Saccharothrix violaceirubra]|uniref:SCO6045-like C-terminal domain-containing protein n=1 Tax=Saccharothrix violaceirubra TaxID=413306 RepID=A0A7W7T6P3_9PSEU|nr:hypothetical protein [Saccharothrix violaceirubra]MBB4967559.1 hypothetical protein [Saccharothrix violaceirubra]
MTAPQRAELARRQAELLRALLADGDVPAGFDPDRVAVEARALLSKRRGIVAMLRPDLVDSLGERFRPLFDTYGRGRPRTDGSRMREDAAAFAEWLADRGELPTRTKRRWWQRADQ